MTIDQLSEIADFLGLKDASKALAFLRTRSGESNSELIIPFVGEFSSGKTTLINALMGGKKLETARERTTATIFEVRFSQDAERAVIFWQDGRQEEVGDITTLKNDRLADARLVQVFDTSRRIPSTTVIADTPGLSSLVPKDREALAAYLPHADAVFIVIDIGTGDATRSLIDFMKVASLARRRVYAILTKYDTKAPPEREKIRVQIAGTLNLDKENIVCVSAKEDDIGEFLELVERIQAQKNEIVREVIEQQTAAIQNALAEQVQMLLKSADMSTDELDGEIAAAKRAEQEIRARIKRTVTEMENIVDSAASKTANDFNRRILDSLEALVRNSPQGDINQAASSAVNSVASLMFTNFKSDVYAEVRNTLRFSDDDNAITITQVNDAIQSADSAVSLSGTVDLSLPELQKANKIAAGVLKGAMFLAATFVTPTKADDIAAAFIPSGMLEGLVGKVTDKTIARPQRQRIINDWIMFTLQPEFKQNLVQISRGVIGNIETLLIESSRESVAELQTNLQMLKAKKLEAASEYKERIARLKTYKTALITDGRSE
jgi:GTPase SAR1 family protein